MQRRCEDHKKLKMPPAVSVVIPCFNEAKHIESCLESVLGFESEFDFEVIVVEGMSTDGTRDILSRLAESHGNLRILDNPARVVPVGMNMAIREAQGETILRLDAHADYPPNYLTLCVETLRRTGAENVGGVVVTLPREDSIQARLVQAITTSKMGVGNSAFRLGAKEGPVDTVPFGCFPRSLFDRIGLFDERLVRHQDYEFNRRIHVSGGKVWLNPKIRVNYYNQPTIRGLYRQAAYSAKWDTWSWLVAPYAFTPRHGIPGVFVLSLFLSVVLSAVSKIFLVLAAVILIPYVILAILSAVKASRGNPWWTAFLLPPLYMGYHVAFGLGSLWGGLLLAFRFTPVQLVREPWPGAGRYRAWPPR